MKSLNELFAEIMEEAQDGMITICSFESESSDVYNEDTAINDLSLKKFKKTRVVVRTRDEGDNKPHFHVIGDKGKYESCIRIDVAEYFLHKPHHIKMINKDLKILDEHLRMVRDDGLTNWEYGKHVWNDVHWKFPIADSVTQPDYTRLNEVKND